MSKFLINLFIKFGKSKSLRLAALSICKNLVAKTDNDLDDKLVELLEAKLFPVK